MQSWLKDGKMERLEDSVLEKHPEKLYDLENQGYVRVVNENDHSVFKEKTIKVVAKKIAKKMKNKK